MRFGFPMHYRSTVNLTAKTYKNVPCDRVKSKICFIKSMMISISNFLFVAFRNMDLPV